MRMGLLGYFLRSSNKQGLRTDWTDSLNVNYFMTKKEKLIVKLYNGSCSREELERLLDLIQDEPEEGHEEVMEKLWEELRSYPELEQPMASEMMQEMHKRMEALDARPAKGLASRESHLGIRFSRRRLVQIAGAAVVLLLVGIFSWLWLSTENLVIVQTAFAEQKTVALPDGSTVKLNANSSLKYRKNWNTDQTRQVWLEGEAYFEVSKKQETGQKFQVVTEDLTVEVLGTIFNVNAREVATKVFLEEGKVSLHLEEQSEEILLEPGELLTYSRSSGKPTKKQVGNETPASWKDGTAILTDVLLEDIVQKIHELYEVTVIVEDKTNLEREFTIFLPVDDPDLGYSMLEGLGLELEKADKIWTVK